MRRSYSSGYNYKPRSVRKMENRSKKALIWTMVLCVGLLYIVFFWIIPYLIGSISNLNKPTQITTSIADDITLAPPVFNIPFEATNTATINITGYATMDAKVEIYVDDELTDTVSSNSDGLFQVTGLNLGLGTNSIYGRTVDKNNKRSLPSKSIRVLYSNDKPSLTISQPEDNKVVQGGDRKIRIAGKTDPDDTVTINGSVVIVNGDGSFAIDRELVDGENSFLISATSQVGNSTQVQRKVTYQP